MANGIGLLDSFGGKNIVTLILLKIERDLWGLPIAGFISYSSNAMRAL